MLSLINSFIIHILLSSQQTKGLGTKGHTNLLYDQRLYDQLLYGITFVRHRSTYLLLAITFADTVHYQNPNIYTSERSSQ